MCVKRLVPPHNVYALYKGRLPPICPGVGGNSTENMLNTCADTVRARERRMRNTWEFLKGNEQERIRAASLELKIYDRSRASVAFF